MVTAQWLATHTLENGIRCETCTKWWQKCRMSKSKSQWNWSRSLALQTDGNSYFNNTIRQNSVFFLPDKKVMISTLNPLERKTSRCNSALSLTLKERDSCSGGGVGCCLVGGTIWSVRIVLYEVESPIFTNSPVSI